MLKGNKGEWSEAYTLVKLLSTGKLFSGNADLEKDQKLVYPIESLIRSDGSATIEYFCGDDCISITGKHKDFKLSRDKFTKYAEILLRKIKQGKSVSFSIDCIEEFLHEIRCNSLKAKSSVKSDICVQVL